MSCEKWLPVLLQAVDDRLDEVSLSDRAGLVSHLEHCAECRQALDEQRVVRAALTARTDAPVPLGLAARVVSEIEGRVSWVDMLRWRTWTFRLAPVALGLLVFGLVTATRDVSQPGEPGELVVGVSDLAEAWAFGEQDTVPVFTLWGQDEVDGDLLLDAILAIEPDEPLPGGDPS